MRVHVLTSLYPSREAPFEGIFARRKWDAFARRGHEVSVVAPVPWAPPALAALLGEERARVARAPRESREGEAAVHRPRFLHVPRRAAGNARAFARVGVEAALRGRPDAVVVDYAWPGAEAAPALRALGVPAVVNGRGSDVLQVRESPRLRPRLAAGLAAASALTAVSQDLLDAMSELRREGGADPGAPAVLTPNGVDPERFSPGDRAAARARLGLAGDGSLVLVVGHLIPRKDPLLALDAFARLERPGARIVFLGRGPLEGEVRAAAARLGVDATLAGERPPEELCDWYRAANALLLTSSREGRPNVVLEALASGLAPVATDAGGTAEVLPDRGAMLVRSRDAGEIAAKLARVLDAPPPVDTLVGAVAALSWGASVDALEDLLARLVEGAAEARPR